MSTTNDTIPEPQVSQPPNFIAVPVENFQAAIEFIRHNIVTGLGVPLLERLGRTINLHIPDENLPPNFKNTDNS